MVLDEMGDVTTELHGVDTNGKKTVYRSIATDSEFR